MPITLYKPTPTAVAQAAHRNDPLAVRRADLRGQKVGLLWNAKPNADVFLDVVREHIARTYSAVTFVQASKISASRGLLPDEGEPLRDCTVVVNAYGD